jgi:release factor glutamine methyltransferase
LLLFSGIMNYHHTITLQAALAAAHESLSASLIPSYRLDARLLLEYATGLSREIIAGYPEREITAAEWEAYTALIARRAAREPLSHITGQREFWGLPFDVTADTLDPRPDSETLIEAALQYFPDKNAKLRILDLGTGSGCLLLSLLSEYQQARGTGIDISPAALEVAKRNSIALKLEERTDFILQSWGKGLSGSYDLIITNPPYIENTVIKTLEPEVASYEPHLALSGGEDGLDCYRALAPDIAALLTPGGVSIIEFGQGQEHDVTIIMAAHQLRAVSYGYDLGGITRCVTVTPELHFRDKEI